MKSLLKKAAAGTAILATSVFPAISQEQVGQATLVRTSVTGGSGPIAVKSPVYRDERIRTSNSGLGEFRFRDGTKFAVGGNSSVVIDRFVYDNSKTFNKLTLNAARGSFRWISGKSKSEAYEIVTPAGTIGIRGTRLDIFVGSGGLTSVVLLSGAARFCTPTGCEDLRRRCDVIVATTRRWRQRCLARQRQHLRHGRHGPGVPIPVRPSAAVQRLPGLRHDKLWAGSERFQDTPNAGRRKGKGSPARSEPEAADYSDDC